MRVESNLKTIPDDELLRRLSDLLRASRRVEADLVAHIAEVDARRLYAREAAPSMFAYCTEILHLSEPEAALRIRVARASRSHSVILTMLRDGRIHLSGVALLAPVLTRANRATLLKRATHKSKRQIEELVAEMAPRPDVKGTMRKLPVRHHEVSAAPASPGGSVTSSPDGTGGARAAATEQRPDAVVPVSDCGSESSRPQLRPVAVVAAEAGAAESPFVSSPVPHTTGRAAVEALAPARYSIRFTASAELHDKLERLQALMRHSVPDGYLATIIDRAVTRELERLEARRFGKTGKPRTGDDEVDTRPKSRHVPAAVRRAVHQRDGGRCTYRDNLGRQCTKRHDLEFHHRKPFARGGDHSVEALTLMCRTHNVLMAERDYGREVMARFRRSGNRRSEPVTIHGHPAAETRGCRLGRSPGATGTPVRLAPIRGV
jgi:hypothetical protein